VGSNFSRNIADQHGGALFSYDNCADFMIIDVEGYNRIQTSYDKLEVKPSDSVHSYIIRMIDSDPFCDQPRYMNLTTPDMVVVGWISESIGPGIDAIPIFASKASIQIYNYYCRNSIKLFGIPVVDASFIPCKFDHNIARGNGGAIYFNTNNEFPIIVNALFDHNQANYLGGAIYLGSNNHGAVFGNIRLHGNTAESSGGGMYLSSYNSGIQIHNSTFISNKAVVAGGAISLQLNNGEPSLLLL